MLTVVDCYTQESLDIHVDQSLKGEDVVRVLNNIVAARGKPITIKTDNGSEFISKVMDKWAYERGVSMPVVISPLWPVEFSPTPGSFGLSALL